MASADRLKIGNVEGRQTHGSQPWRGIDPVVTSAQIILALQTIVSRQLDPTLAPAVVSVSTIHGGVRNNILPDSVAIDFTIRTHDEGVRAEIWKRIRQDPPPALARAAGACKASVTVFEGVPVTLTIRRSPTGAPPA